MRSDRQPARRCRALLRRGPPVNLPESAHRHNHHFDFDFDFDFDFNFDFDFDFDFENLICLDVGRRS